MNVLNEMTQFANNSPWLPFGATVLFAAVYHVATKNRSVVVNQAEALAEVKRQQVQAEQEKFNGTAKRIRSNIRDQCGKLVASAVIIQTPVKGHLWKVTLNGVHVGVNTGYSSSLFYLSRLTDSSEYQNNFRGCMAKAESAQRDPWAGYEW